MLRPCSGLSFPVPRLRGGRQVRGDGSCGEGAWRKGAPCGNVMKCHAMSWRRAAASALRPVSPPGRGEGRLRSCVPPSEPGAGRMSLFCARFACAGPRAHIAAARFARVIARARRAGGGPLRKCHEMSCDVMEARGGLCLAAGFAASSGRGSFTVMRASFQAKQRAGRCVPVSRAIARACARGCGRAYRGGAVRAADCARETPDAPRPSVPAGVFFAAPASRFLQKRRKAAPGEPPLSTFILHHTAKCQAL